MNHPRPIDLSAFADGALDPDGERLVSEHVNRCAACAAEVRGLRTLREAVRSVPPVEPGPWFAERLEAMVHGEEEALHQWDGPERVAARTVVGLALIVAALVVVFALTPESSLASDERFVAPGAPDTTNLLLASGDLSRDDLLFSTLGGE